MNQTSEPEKSDSAVGTILNPVELRVLGALIEKEITTPDQYPLSLNALVNACNQRSSRDPVLDLTESDVRDALRTLEELSLITPTRDARVPKYEHRARTVLNLRRDETALLCLLLLRGPQTPGELRSRSDRLYQFDDLASVVSALERLAARPAGLDPARSAPLTLQLPRQPGAREARYTHLLGNPAQIPQPAPSNTGPSPASSSNLEAEIRTLRAQVEELAERLARLEQSLS